ncbi:hypothetical protein A11Q_1542 [Pseudobdellovibrio exovorus JSS]|uniref:SH3b domain-containing protein n=1 Tax=Pseudobdellovibrio exovorus JSS TaxID=1184267 RepID=M4V958_9BACT|nr:hypothetical protein A11Q_1542 [Pseudobdellovibrio exovorus JSS]
MLCFFVLSQPLLAAQNATIIGSEVEIYKAGDFDSEIIDYVRSGEAYQISDKTYGPFYRIRLKDGRIGYIVDYELDIEGKGRIVPKDLDDLLLEEERQRQGQMPDTPSRSNEEEEFNDFNSGYGGITVQLINYHEKTMGDEQIADLIAIGYKSISLVSWSVIGSYGAPKYYAQKTGGSANGFKLWGDFGFSSSVITYPKGEVRVGGGLFTHVSMLTVETPQRKYDLHDVTGGLFLEGGWLIKLNKKNAIDVAIKYYFDKASYAGFGLSYLF